MDARRWLGVVIITAGVTVGCTDDEPAAEPGTTTTTSLEVPLGDPVDTESIVVSDERAAVIGRVGDDILIIDGLAGLQDGDEPRMQAWLVDALVPESARALDLGELGPYWDLHTVAWGDGLAVTGLRCPDTVDPPPPDDTIVEPQTDLDACGSRTWDLFRLLPGETSTLERVMTREASEDYGFLSLIGTNSAGDLLIDGATLLSVSWTGEVRELPDPGDVSFVCMIGGELHTLTRVQHEQSGVNGDARPMNDFLTLQRLGTDGWEGLDLPPTGVMTVQLAAMQCVDDGFAGQTIDVVADDANQIVSREQSAQLLVPADSTSDGLRWSAPPMGSLPEGAGEPLNIAVLDGTVTVSGVNTPRVEGQPTDAWWYAWDGGEWVDIGSDYGDLAFYGFTPVQDVRFTGDASMAVDDLGLIWFGDNPDGDLDGGSVPADVVASFYGPEPVTLGP